MLLKLCIFFPKCGNKILQAGTTSSVISRAATTASTSASSACFPTTISNFETLMSSATARDILEAAKKKHAAYDE